MLTETEVLSNWDKHLKIIDRYIVSSERKVCIKSMYSSMEDRVILAPASGKEHFHNAFAGGYIDHVNRVVESCLRIRGVWEQMGADMDFEEEELVFAALFHDLGKVGDGAIEGYVIQEDKWRRDKLGEKFSINPALPFMLIQDRSLFLLQKFNIPISLKEYLGIKLHDGLYDESNKSYFISHSPESKLRTNLVHILSQADLVASKVEYDRWKNKEDKPKK